MRRKDSIFLFITLARRIVSFLAVLLVFPIVVFAGFSGEVVSVLDGDTIEVLHNGKAQRVRLYGIDCPEKGQAFGSNAKQAMSSMVFALDVTLEIHGKDKYGRILADVLLADGTNVNHSLVKDGWCWWFRKYAPSDRELEALEQAARQAKQGLWIDPNPIPPWDYRKAQRSPKNSSPSASNLRNSVDRQYTSIIGNRDSHRYHRSDCPSYGDISSGNRVEFASEIEAEAAGYRRAGNCPSL